MVFLHIQDNIDNYNNKIKNNQRILFCLCFTYRFYLMVVYKKIEVMMQ
jgi:hypothetical protein